MAQRSTDPPAIEAEIERIRSLGLDALRARWRSMFDAMPPMALTKDLIAQMMIHRIQEEAGLIGPPGSSWMAWPKARSPAQT